MKSLSVLACLLFAVFGVGGCAFAIQGSDSEADARAEIWVDPFAHHDLVDLTYALSEDSLYWPNGSPFEYERQLWGAGEDGKWYAMGYFSTTSPRAAGPTPKFRCGASSPRP